MADQDYTDDDMRNEEGMQQKGQPFQDDSKSTQGSTNQSDDTGAKPDTKRRGTEAWTEPGREASQD